VDYWSIGVIVYTLLCGRPPFESAEVKNTYKKIKTCSYSFPEGGKLSEQAKCFIAAVLVLDPKKRLTLQQMMEHEFMTNNAVLDRMPVSTLVCPPSQAQCQRLTETTYMPPQPRTANLLLSTLNDYNSRSTKQGGTMHGHTKSIGAPVVVNPMYPAESELVPTAPWSHR
jgi:serine/threonine protein kinase